MKKVLSILLLCVFALSFVGGIAISETNAKTIKYCSKGCIDGYWYICCPVGKDGGKLKCYWGDPC